MQNSTQKSINKTTAQLLSALLGTTLIVGTGSAQTVVVDNTPALTLTTQTSGGIALSSIAINPLTGDAVVRTNAGNINSCTNNGQTPVRSVAVSAPATAAASATFNVSWTASNFTGATTCSLSGGTNATGWSGSNLPYDANDLATRSRQVTLAATQPASYSFTVTCSDGVSAQNTATTSVQGSTGGCPDPNAAPYLTSTLSVNAVRNWENTFSPGGSGNVPFPGVPNRQFSASLSRGAYDAMRFVVPVTLTPGFRADLVNFVTTGSPAGVVVQSVSECQGDFRPAQLVNDSTRRLCLGQGGVGGTAVGVVVDAGPGPYPTETCEVVRGRTYFVNSSFGTSSNQASGQAYCVEDACIYNLEYRQTRSAN